MKQLSILATLVMFAQIAFSQNVGIGEENPTVKLTVKGTGSFPSLLVKNSVEDSLFFASYLNLYLGGYHEMANGVVNITNKNYLPNDPPTLSLIAAGERSSGSVNGSLATLRFTNANTSKYFDLMTYTGTEGNAECFRLDYRDPNDGSGQTNILMFMRPNGQTGFGSYDPRARMQINHRSSILNPTLSLVDSGVNTLPSIQLRNVSGTDYFQVRGNTENGNPQNSFLNFATQNGIRMTLRGDGNLGLGVSNPAQKLDISGSMRLTGEVNRTSTGAANLTPICYGTVNAAGDIHSGSGNFSVTHTLTGLYSITITGESFVFSQYTTVVTVIGSSPVIATTSSGGGALHIYVHSTAGDDVDGQFNFVVYQQ